METINWSDKSTKISRYLTVGDVIKSSTASRLKIDNSIAAEHMMAVQDTAVLFDKIKDKFPDAFPSSFYRSKALNDATPGASATSQHCKGEAVDVDSLGDVRNKEIFEFIRDNLAFDQLILEYPDEKGLPDWVHVSTTRRRANRNMIIVKLKSKEDPIAYSQYKIGMV